MGNCHICNGRNSFSFTGKKNIATFEVKKDNEETLSKASDDVEESIDKATEDKADNL